MWRIALVCVVCVAACAPTWTKPSFRPTAVADARATAAREHACPEDRIHFKRDATDWQPAHEVWEPGGVIGTVADRAPRWTFVLDVCGEQHIYLRPITDSPYRDPSFEDLDAPTTPGPLHWSDI